jgi:hypothetical protein
MPGGGRLRSYRLGDRSELLVQHLLSGVAFTTPVPRQEDIGVDFLCSLITGPDDVGLLRAGPFFTVQAKSNVEAVVYQDPHQLEWIKHQENPLLFCVADRKAAAMDVYSTWNLLWGVVGGGWEGREPTRMILRPGVGNGDWHGVKNEPDGSQNIWLGKPIVRVTHDDIFDEEKTKRVAEVLSEWVALDRTNIVNRYAGLYYVAGPLTYETGKPLGPVRGVLFAWNPMNLEKCTTNIGLSATALWRVLHHPGIATRTDVKKAPWPAGLSALRELLRWYRDTDPQLKDFLADLDS